MTLYVDIECSKIVDFEGLAEECNVELDIGYVYVVNRKQKMMWLVL